MPALIDLPDEYELMHLSYGFIDDFQGFLTATSTDKYTVVTVTDGSALQIDARLGGVAIKSAVASAAGDEDCYLVREAETFKFLAAKPLKFRALVQATEDDTNQNNLIVGLTSAAAADLLVSAGAGPKTGGDTVGFYKVDGGLNWWVYVRINGTLQLNVELTAANSRDKAAHVGSGTAQQLLGLDFIPKNSTQADLEFTIDGTLVYKFTDMTFASSTDVQCVCGCKDGDAGDETTISLFAWYCRQMR